MANTKSAVATLPTPLIALAGTPNTGKTALFNALTKSHQKVANYAGVTVERKEGIAKLNSKTSYRILDLPGTYSLDPRSPDEQIALDILLDKKRDEVGSPNVIICVADATNLERHLSFVLELRTLNRPVILALNMYDLAEKRGLSLDLQKLSTALGIPVIPTAATRGRGIKQLMSEIEKTLLESPIHLTQSVWKPSTGSEIRARFNEVDRILKLATQHPAAPSTWTERIDSVVLSPYFGHILLLIVLAIVFQAVFTWAGPAMDAIEAAVLSLGAFVSESIPNGFMRSLLVDGVIAGVGSVLVFLPQILLLFFFILVLEDSGYMARAAFLMDRLMSSVGLNGKAFIPLLSSYACAIPGIMATRTIPTRRDRLITIFIAPLMTCSARLPVYALLIAAFIPNTSLWGPIRLQGVVLFLLYGFSIPAALLVAYLFKRFSSDKEPSAFILEMPTYKIPDPINILVGLKERAFIFLKRAGQIILVCSVALWFLASFPKPKPGETEPAINVSFAGRIGHAIEPIVRPLGFDWRIATAMIPGFAAREVMVGALGTVFSIEADSDEATETALASQMTHEWELPTALALLIWYVFSPQCLSTFAVIRRETNSWKWPALVFSYMLVAAYLGAWATYSLSSWLLL